MTNAKSRLSITGASLSTPNSQKKTYGRPKSAEPGSPLLRRALSPDRLHPRSAENKTSISPLANAGLVKVTPRLSISAQSTYPESSDEGSGGCSDSGQPGKDELSCKTESGKDRKPTMEPQQKSGPDYSKLGHGISISIANVPIPMNSSQLPRIAEEKDSPTGTKDLVEVPAPVPPPPPTPSTVEPVNKLVKQIQDESLCETYDVQRKNSSSDVGLLLTKATTTTMTIAESNSDISGKCDSNESRKSTTKSFQSDGIACSSRADGTATTTSHQSNPSADNKHK